MQHPEQTWHRKELLATNLTILRSETFVKQ